MRTSEEKQRFTCVKNGEKLGEIAKGHFSKIAETAHQASSTEAAYSEHSIAIHSISMAGYVTPVPAFVCVKLPSRKANSLCEFWQLTSCDFTAFVSFTFGSFLDVLNKDNYC